MSQQGLKVLKWSARTASILFLVVGLMMALGPDPYREARPLRLDEIVGLVFLPWGMLAGSLLGWRRPMAGGLIAVGCLPAFFLSQWLLGGGVAFSPVHLLPVVPGLLFLALAFAGKGRPAAADR
ncbi:MAG: hypothetical protein RDU89_05190 [bacterium]|nr:hypothetical protein [bacterium]